MKFLVSKASLERKRVPFYENSRAVRPSYGKIDESDC